MLIWPVRFRSLTANRKFQGWTVQGFVKFAICWKEYLRVSVTPIEKQSFSALRIVDRLSSRT